MGRSFLQTAEVQDWTRLALRRWQPFCVGRAAAWTAMVDGGAGAACSLSPWITQTLELKSALCLFDCRLNASFTF